MHHQIWNSIEVLKLKGRSGEIPISGTFFFNHRVYLTFWICNVSARLNKNQYNCRNQAVHLDSKVVFKILTICRYRTF